MTVLTILVSAGEASIYVLAQRYQVLDLAELLPTLNKPWRSCAYALYRRSPAFTVICCVVVRLMALMHLLRMRFSTSELCFFC